MYATRGHFAQSPQTAADRGPGASADEDSPAYRDVETYLRRARDANRRQDVYVKYLYIIAQDPKHPTAAHFVVDAEEEGENKSHFGEAYKTHVAVRNRFRFTKGDLLQVKGKAESIQVYSVDGPVA